MASFKINFNFPRFQGGPTYVFKGGVRSNLSQGDRINLKSYRTCDKYWTPVPPLDPRNYHAFYSSTAILFLDVYFHLS